MTHFKIKLKNDIYYDNIRKLNDAIKGEEISKKISEIENICETFSKLSNKYPEFDDDLNKVVNYYLPTVIKVLESYDFIDNSKIQTQNSLKYKDEAEKFLESSIDAMTKLYDSILSKLNMDNCAEIDLSYIAL